jgi:hypothetical protein
LKKALAADVRCADRPIAITLGPPASVRQASTSRLPDGKAGRDAYALIRETAATNKGEGEVKFWALIARRNRA